MPEYEQTASIDAEPDDLFYYLADAKNMPEYVPILNEVDVRGEEVQAELNIHGEDRRSAGWVHVDELERRVEWGAKDGPYHGWLQVDPGDIGGSLVTVHIHQEHESDADDDLLEALDNVRRYVTAEGS